MGTFYDLALGRLVDRCHSTFDDKVSLRRAGSIYVFDDQVVVVVVAGSMNDCDAIATTVATTTLDCRKLL